MDKQTNGHCDTLSSWQSQKTPLFVHLYVKSSLLTNCSLSSLSQLLQACFSSFLIRQVVSAIKTYTISIAYSIYSKAMDRYSYKSENYPKTSIHSLPAITAEYAWFSITHYWMNIIELKIWNKIHITYSNMYLYIIWCWWCHCSRWPTHSLSPTLLTLRMKIGALATLSVCLVRKYRNL